MINVGIIGFGNIGTIHKKRIDENGHLRLLAIADIKDVKRSDTEDPEIVVYRDYKDLVKREDINLVSVCTPNDLHAQMVIDGLNAEKNILCEKPMALTTSDCQKMVDVSLKSSRKLFIVKQNRYNPPVKKVKELIDSGILGRIFQIVTNCYWNRNENYYKSSSWRGDSDKDGGCLFTQFSHFIDLMYWFVGEVKSVVAFISNVNHPYIDIDDVGSVSIEFESGALGTINFTNNTYKENMEGSITVFAENGTIKIGGKYLNELEYQRIKDHEIKDIPISSGPNNYGSYQGSMSNHHKVYENVVRSLQGEEDIFVTGIEGMKTVEIIEMIYKSARDRRIVEK